MKAYTKPAKIDNASSDPKVWSLAKLQESLRDKGISGKHERSFDKAKQSAASLRAHLAQRLDVAEVDARSQWPLSGHEKNKHDSGGSSSTLNTSNAGASKKAQAAKIAEHDAAGRAAGMVSPAKAGRPVGSKGGQSKGGISEQRRVFNNGPSGQVMSVGSKVLTVGMHGAALGEHVGGYKREMMLVEMTEDPSLGGAPGKPVVVLTAFQKGDIVVAEEAERDGMDDEEEVELQAQGQRRHNEMKRMLTDVVKAVASPNRKRVRYVTSRDDHENRHETTQRKADVAPAAAGTDDIGEAV